MAVRDMAEGAAASGAGVLATVMGAALGWIDVLTDASIAFLLGAAGAAGGLALKVGVDCLKWKFNQVKNRLK